MRARARARAHTHTHTLYLIIFLQEFIIYASKIINYRFLKIQIQSFSSYY